MQPEVIWFTGSQHCLYNIMTWEVLKVPIPGPHPIPVKSELLAIGPGHQNY